MQITPLNIILVIQEPNHLVGHNEVYGRLNFLTVPNEKKDRAVSRDKGGVLFSALLCVCLVGYTRLHVVDISSLSRDSHSEEDNVHLFRDYYINTETEILYNLC